MRRHRGVVAACLGVVLVAVPSALAGAPNYDCSFGVTRIAGDVWAKSGRLREARGAISVIAVPAYASGGMGFTASANGLTWAVRLTGKPQIGVPGSEATGPGVAATLRTTGAGSQPGLKRGTCVVLPGDHVLGVLRAGGAVRAEATATAAVVALPGVFLWAPRRFGDKRSTKGWAYVVVRAGDRIRSGFVRPADARFVE